MSAPGSAKAPDKSAVEFEKKKEEAREKKERSDAASPWHIWKQVLIAELLNLLERRRYDAPGTK
jgi:hypothetical protein